MKNPSKRITWKEISRQKFLMVCAAIFFVYGIVFYYVPLAGWVMAFQDYKPKDGLFGSKFVGLGKFKFLFSDDVFLRDIRNTLAMGVLNLVTTFLMAIIFAILLNEVRNMFGKKLVQTVSYLPHFLSWIIVTGILHDALSSTGIINELLVNLFHNVMDAEAKAVITDEFKDITNNDMHILEAIGIEELKSMSRIAGELHVTVGTLTTNMNSLERKGYLTRNRSTRDKRVVLVTLTEKGRKAFFHHRDFHRKMIHTIIRDLDEEEMKTLIKCLGKLDIFFREGNEE